MKDLSSPVADTDLALERGLFPVPFTRVPPPSSSASFHWQVRPEGDMARGTFYSDGSLIDGPSKLLGRCGWAFVALDSNGFVVAAACGVTPPWITCIPGAESWAALQAAKVAWPGSTFRIDCEPCVLAIHAGMARACSDANPLARVHQLLAIAFDDTPLESVVWMPSHTSEAEVGVRRIGNGDFLSMLDRYGNGEADTWAKHAVEEHRVPEHIRRELKDAYALVGRTAKWIGAATWHANHSSGRPGRDTGASRQAAVSAARAAKARRGERLTNISKVRTPAMGGHDLVQVGATWQCLVCRQWSHSKGKLETKGCPGSAISKWKRREVNAILQSKAVEPGTEGSRVHRRMISGDLIWCSVCGSYAEHRARGLEDICEGKFQGTWKGGGREGQRRDLLAGKHPKSGKPLPPAVTESQWMAGERPALMTAMVGLQSSAPPIRLCSVSSCILDRLRAAKRQADRDTAPDEGVSNDGGSGSTHSISKRRRITGKTMPATPGGTIVVRPSLGADPEPRS